MNPIPKAVSTVLCLSALSRLAAPSPLHAQGEAMSPVPMPKASIPIAPVKKVTARVAGRVLDGTPVPSKPAPGLSIELVRPGGLNGQSSAVLKTVRTGADGHFDFGPMQLNPSEILTTRVRTRGFDYETPAYDARGQLKQFMPQDAKPIDPLAVEMTIFDAVDTVPLTFTVHHVAIATAERQLKVTERIVAENHTRTTMVGGADGATVRLNLPEGAHDVELDQEVAPGGKLLKKADGYWVAKAITPEQYGSRNAIIVKYHMDFQGGAVDLSRKLAYPVKFFFMAREQKDKELTIDAPLLSKDQVQQIPIDGAPQDRLVNSKGMPMGEPVFQPGTLITMRVSRPADPMQWGFVGFIGALLLIVPAALLLTRQSGKGKIEDPAGDGSVIGAHRAGPLQIDETTRSLIERIAVLDEQWDAGDISRNEYTKQRAALKQQALGNAVE